ncbi:MAG: medium chain dehydrogenase/reductase family protein [Bacteroidales bacterium]
MSYKKVVITEYGTPEVMQLIEEATLPEPKADEVRIKVINTSANFTDMMIRKGKYPDVKDKPPFALGYDMAGIVDKTGSGVTSLKTGDRVADMTVIGAYSEYICLPVERLIPIPASLDTAEAVALILSYTTAYQLLHRNAKVNKGDSILIHGASGAVGTAMLQLGRLHNLTMYGTASKPNHDKVKSNGGIPIDYKSEDFVQQISELTDNGVDAVFDPIGGKNFKKSFKSLKPGGKLVAFGFYNSVMGKDGNIPLDFMKILMWNIFPNGKSSGFYSIDGLRKKHPDWFKADLQSLFGLLEDGKIQPEIAGHVPLEKARSIHEKMEKEEITGKIIFDVG